MALLQRTPRLALNRIECRPAGKCGISHPKACGSTQQQRNCIGPLDNQSLTDTPHRAAFDLRLRNRGETDRLLAAGATEHDQRVATANLHGIGIPCGVATRR